MKKVLFAVAVVVIVAVVWIAIYTHPKHVTKTFTGVEYHAGVASAAVKPVRVTVTGTLQRFIGGILTFEGIIKLEGNTQTNPDNNRLLTVHFDGPGGMGLIDYGYYTNGTPVTHPYGNIFISHNFAELVILESNGGWTSTDGLTIAAPASNRSQALSISNNLMKGWLNGQTVK